MSSYVGLFNSTDGSYDNISTELANITYGAQIDRIMVCGDNLGFCKWTDAEDVIGVKSATGTLNQVLVNGTYSTQQNGDIILTLPQSIATTSDVEFNKLSFNTTNITSLTPNELTINAGVTNIVSDLNVIGNVTYISTTSFEIKDNLIDVGYGNSSDVVDLGIIFDYNQLATNKWAAIYRRNNTNRFVFKVNILSLPTSVIGTNGDLADLEVNDVYATNINAIDYYGTDYHGTNFLGNATTATTATTAITATTATTALTVSDAAQPAITTLANLASIQGQSILSGVWAHVAGLNQNLSTGSSPTFITLNAININATDIYGEVKTSSQPSILTLDNLSSVQGSLFNSTKWAHLATINQDLSTSSSPFFTSLSTSTTLSATNQVSSKNFVATIEMKSPLITATTQLNVNSPAGTTGDINSGAAGVYSWNGGSRYVRFNTNGGANDLLSAGAAMAINYNGGSNGVRPENVELFGYYATSPSILSVNGNLSLGNGAFDTVSSTSRTLTVKAGTAQSSTPLLNITDSSNVSLMSVSADGIFSNYGTGAGGSPHIIMRTSGVNRYIMGLQNTESSGNAGSDFRLFSYTDAGGYLGAPLQIKRSNSAVTLEGPLNLQSVADNTNGNITSGSYTPVTSSLTSLTQALPQSTFKYHRIGSWVTVIGNMYMQNSSNIPATAYFHMTLPYTLNNFILQDSATGVATNYGNVAPADNGNNWIVFAVGSTQLVRVYTNNAFAGGGTFASLNFTYQIV